VKYRQTNICIPCERERNEKKKCFEIIKLTDAAAAAVTILFVPGEYNV